MHERGLQEVQARQEHRAGTAAGDQARQQPRAPGPEEQLVRVAALRSRAGTLACDVDLLDVQAQHLVCARRRLKQQPPQRALAQRDVVTFPQPLERSEEFEDDR